MKTWMWITLGVVVGIVILTRRKHPISDGNLTSWGQAFKIAFLGASYKEPVSFNCPPGMVGMVDVLSGGTKCVPASIEGGLKI